MESFNKLKIFRYEDSEKSVYESPGPTIFLAGPTVREYQPHLTSWRYEAVELFKENNFEGNIIVPEFINKNESDKDKKWIPLWEFNGLKRADCIMFWIPRTKELIGLTTNWEIGYWIGKHKSKIIYGRPDEAYKIGYVDTMWEAVNKDDGQDFKIYNTLSDTVKASIMKL